MSKEMIIVGNWKMNGNRNSSAALASEIAKDILPKNVSVILCPPYLYIQDVAKTGVTVGGQNCHNEAKGAYTGEISAEMLKDAGCKYVILGHSERRNYNNESSLLVSQKAASAHKAGLVTIICVGETQEERNSGKTIEVISKQLKESVPNTTSNSNTIIAYEPVWAIGSGKTPTEGDISKVHLFIKSQFNFSVLYGGSVKPQNTKEIIASAGVDGLLVGGASLNANEFIGIVRAAIV